VAADVLPLADGTALSLGTVEDGADRRVALWHLGSAGEADTRFGDRGVMRPFALPLSQGLALHADVDGSVLLAIQTGLVGRTWIEVHRWRQGESVPVRIARQVFPDEWVGPADLAQRDGRWVWVDSAQPSAAAVPWLPMTPDSPWSDRAAAPARPPAAESAVGHAVMNPFGEVPSRTPDAAPSPEDATPWASLVTALLAALGAALLLVRALAR
jgi:hypothetical protein